MPTLEVPDDTPFAVYIHDWSVERAFPAGPFVTGWTPAARPASHALPLEVSVSWGAPDAFDPSQPLSGVYYPVGSTLGGLPSWTLGTTFMPGFFEMRSYADGS